jgi:chemotaxis protein histidine kinase CheA
MEQELIDKYRRIYRETTNALAKETAKKKLEEAGVPLTEGKAKPTPSEPKKKAEPKAKPEPKAKAEPKKPTSASKDDYDCDDLIKQAKERKAKAKANAQKRANAPKKTTATKNKEAVEKTTTRVEKSVESRAKKGEVKVAELEKLIAEYEEAIKKLKALLSKVKSGSKFAKGGNMGMMDAKDSREYNRIKDHNCGCGDKKMAKGGGIYSSDKLFIVKVYDSDFNLLDGSRRVFATNSSKAKQEAIDRLEDEMQQKYGTDLMFRVEEAPSMFAKGGTTESSDRKYSALKSGKRTSRKYASVEMRGGGVYHRRNANQYGKVKGGKTYYEYSENRTDSKRYLEKGGNLSSKESLLFFVENEMSSGMIANKCDYSDYKTIDKIKAEMVNILKSDGDRKYSIAETNKLVSKAVKNLGL